MRAVGLKVLKNKLSEYIRLAAGGETVLVTDRDRVDAETGPPQPGRAEFLEDARPAAAVREGWLAPPGAPSIPSRPSRNPVRTFDARTWRRSSSCGRRASPYSRPPTTSA
jgi:antitoxin (DNA-binding transcriptional repressor) of toxin-antitoxin stability system